MLIEVDIETYNHYFPVNPHPFLSAAFIELNKNKVDKIIRLVDSSSKPVLGIVAGLKDTVLSSPFSAPFGGFHFQKQNIYISEIDNFINSMKSFMTLHGYSKIELTLPPDLYHPTFNAKVINSLIRNGFQNEIPEITNWVNLSKFNGSFSQRNSREYYNQAVRHGLSFSYVFESKEEQEAYELIRNNREKFGRPIYMNLNDIIRTRDLWPVDFFKVTDRGGAMVASAIIYQNHPEICFPVFWGDNECGRPLRAMDFLAFNLWSYYKSKGYKFIDLGISTENGCPNEGLLRFKESHEADSSLRYKFIWQN